VCLCLWCAATAAHHNLTRQLYDICIPETGKITDLNYSGAPEPNLVSLRHLHIGDGKDYRPKVREPVRPALDRPPHTARPLPGARPGDVARVDGADSGARRRNPYPIYCPKSWPNCAGRKL
jgi:hypothetical protein